MSREAGKRCGKCWKYRISHIYPFKIGGKWLKLCSECWEIVSEGKQV
jgi:hypothetical protein